MLLSDAAVVERVLTHIDAKTTDLAAAPWREPVANYCSEARLAAERELMRAWPVPFCPSAALPDAGSYVAGAAAGTPLLAVRGEDGAVRAFRNACRHRGAQVASGMGCAQAFTCPYHAWTYALDGRLRAIPHEYGFAHVDRASHGLVPVQAVERSGLVFVTQDTSDPRGRGALPDALPPIVPSDYRMLGVNEQLIEANWKIAAEGFIEGYHIRATHTNTFYPVQYDNVNVIEHFGRNSRVTFPYRAVEKLRGVPPNERRAEGRVTYVYHLFPTVIVATFPGRLVVVALDPVDLAHTRQRTFTLTNRADDVEGRAAVKTGVDFVNAGAVEDREVVASVQRGVASGANEHFEFGLFEGALAHFHRNLHELLGA